MVILEVVVVARVRVREASGTAVLVADGILVDRGIGLGCAVVGRGNAITGFTAIVTVPVIHSTVWVFIYTETHGKRKKWKKKEYYESNDPNLQLLMWYRNTRLQSALHQSFCTMLITSDIDETAAFLYRTRSFRVHPYAKHMMNIFRGSLLSSSSS